MNFDKKKNLKSEIHLRLQSIAFQSLFVKNFRNLSSFESSKQNSNLFKTQIILFDFELIGETTLGLSRFLH